MTALVLALLLSSPAKAPAAPDVSLARLEAELGRLAPAAGGAVGVAALHLESGRRVSLRPDERFPMASTYKVPLAVQLLWRVDRGEVGLADRLDLEAADLHPGSGLLTELFKAPGTALSVRNLLELTLRESDNSATDKLMAVAGGPAAVTARMRSLGLDGHRRRPSHGGPDRGLCGSRDAAPGSHARGVGEGARGRSRGPAEGGRGPLRRRPPRHLDPPGDGGAPGADPSQGRGVARRAPSCCSTSCCAAAPGRAGSRASCLPTPRSPTRPAPSAAPRTTWASSPCPTAPGTSPWRCS